MRISRGSDAVPRRAGVLLPELTPPYPAQHPGVVVAPLRGRRWRVTRGDGGVLGYIAEVGGNYPFEVSRIRVPSLQRMPLGAFATAEDALEAIRAA